MDDMKTWAFTICAAGIVGGIVTILSPKKYEKTIKLIYGALFLLCIFAPMKKIAFKFGADLSFFDANKSIESRVEDKTKEIFLKQASENIKNVIINELLSIDIKTERVIVTLDIDSENNIKSLGIKLNLPNIYKSREDEIQTLIYEKTKVNAQISFTGEEKCM